MACVPNNRLIVKHWTPETSAGREGNLPSPPRLAILHKSSPLLLGEVSRPHLHHKVGLHHLDHSEQNPRLTHHPHPCPNLPPLTQVQTIDLLKAVSPRPHNEAVNLPLLWRRRILKGRLRRLLPARRRGRAIE
jgi:hypothetical protein